MRTLDWVVLALTLASIVSYGIYKGRGSRNIKGYLLADRQMRWYTVALSIMATQASAITFTSTPGQAFVDGMRFVQYYLGLPIAMVILSITAVPIFHKLGVFTAYEYLEHRFDSKTRTLTSIIFLVSRGLGAGMTIYAPSVVLSVMLGWDIRLTSTLIGGAVIIYTTSGGVKAVNWTDFQQLLIIMFGMFVAFFMTIHLLPADVGFAEALHVAGGMGKLNLIDFSFDLSNRYNFWSGIIGGMFVALAYFGTDQSQVQRYLTGQSVTQSRLGLLFNGMAKVPMQFFILLLGAMVFVFYQFERPPLFFNPVETQKIRESSERGVFEQLEQQHEGIFRDKSEKLRDYLQALRAADEPGAQQSIEAVRSAQEREQLLRKEAARIVEATSGPVVTNDTNYIFLSFVSKYLPVGLVGLVFACIFAATMSSSSGELSALATCSIVDVYKRHVRKNADERHYLVISRILMALWGVYGIGFAQFASGLGSLVEAVNIIGSLFYGTMLGVFLTAFYLKSIKGTAVFWGAVVSQAVVLTLFASEYFLGIVQLSWLWYPVVGCLVVAGVALVFHRLIANKKASSLT
ncbi:MAG: sodium:solute symporter [Ignavibacteriales bacterium]|nr:sodium:solute symporter [Ignavibacteriales bacterium]